MTSKDIMMDYNDDSDKKLSYLLGHKDDVVGDRLRLINKKAKKGINYKISKEITKISFTQSLNTTIVEIDYRNLGQMDTLRNFSKHRYNYVGFPIFPDDKNMITICGVVCPNIKIYEYSESNKNVVNDYIKIEASLPKDIAKTLLNKIYKKEEIEIFYKLIEQGNSYKLFEKESMIFKEDSDMITRLSKILKNMDYSQYTNNIKLSPAFTMLSDSYDSFENEETWFQHELKIFDIMLFLDNHRNLSLEVAKPNKVQDVIYSDSINEIIEFNEEFYKMPIGDHNKISEWLEKRMSIYTMFFTKDYTHRYFYKQRSIKDMYKDSVRLDQILGNL